VRTLLSWMLDVPVALIYLTLGAGAAVENVIPAIPADTFVALGGLLSSLGNLNASAVFTVTWTANVGSALVMYRLGYTRGRAFFDDGVGRRFLAPHQLARMEAFYGRWGLLAIFFTRFLPGLRAVVPIFAGVSQHGFVPVAVPLMAASALWYGGLVWLGAFAGRNLARLAELMDSANQLLGLLAALALGAVAIWWWRTRHPPDD